MICPKCKEEGKTSRVFPNNSTTTLMYCSGYYDEQGKYHMHDYNINTNTFNCSNGHSWEQKTYGSCWCGWNNEPAKVENDGKII